MRLRAAQNKEWTDERTGYCRGIARAPGLPPNCLTHEVRLLAEHLAFRDLQPDEVLVPEGTSDDHLYVIVHGALGVVRSAGTSESVTLFAPERRGSGRRAELSRRNAALRGAGGDWSDARVRTRARQARSIAACCIQNSSTE